MKFIYNYYKLQCSKCFRKILVEIHLIGVSHNASVTAICADCITMKEDSDFAKDKPKAYKDITNWIKE